MSLRLVACLLMLMSVTNGAQLGAGEAPTTVVSATPAATEERSLLASETKQYVAQLTEQRNLMRQENDTLRSRQGLLLVYGVLLTLLSGWLMFRALRSTRPGDKKDEIGTNPFPASGGTTVTVRKNATITIRNSSTQQAEVVGKVQTRQAYSRTETASHTRPATRTVERRDTTPMPVPITKSTAVAPELDPATPAAPIPVPTPMRHPNTQVAAPRAPVTVRIEQQSDRLEPVDVAVKPGTDAVRRTSGSSTGR